jgi:hypothetical protein
VSLPRLLFDRNISNPLARYLTGFTIRRTQDEGWNTLKDGELLDAAEQAGFFTIELAMDRMWAAWPRRHPSTPDHSRSWSGLRWPCSNDGEAEQAQPLSIGVQTERSITVLSVKFFTSAMTSAVCGDASAASIAAASRKT